MAQLYDEIGVGYSDHRRPDARFAAPIHAALGDAASVVNVGAGTGSYEPGHCKVVAIEPSTAMIRQRIAGSAPAVRATAAALPFRDGAFDAALAVLTLHHWKHRTRGLTELARVARERVVILTFDPQVTGFWLVDDYFPRILEVDRSIVPTLAEFRQALGDIEVREIPVPHDCSDGFLGAYWRRPERYLEAGVRGAISTFGRIGDVEPGLQRLRRDLRDGRWHERHGALLERDELDLGYRLLIGTPRASADRSRSTP